MKPRCPVLGWNLSLGVATIPQHASTGDELMEAADAALYAAKRAGRDTVRMYAAAGPPIATEATVEQPLEAV